MEIEYEELDGKIVSIKREDGVVFKLGDMVNLKQNVDVGKSSNEYIIEEFLSKKSCPRHFPNNAFPRGTIVTNKGVIHPANAAHPEFESDNYKAFNEVTFTVKELMDILHYKHESKLLKATMKKLKKI